ncbi:MAG: GAF domain-containing protein, partial [Cyanobacteriota bacterium]|nr:GAF domain-containing protein [Cyanobacteriota bacterium]
MQTVDSGFGGNMANRHNRIFCRLDGLTPTTREQRRLNALERWGLLDPEAVPAFDEATQTIARALEAPIGILGLLVKDKLWLKSSAGLSSIGLMNQLAASRSIPRNEAFSTYAIDSEQSLVIEDAATDPVFANSILFQHYGVRSYLGVPLIASDGQCLGALAVMDLEPRQFSDRDLDYVSLVARWCLSEFERDRFLSERRNGNFQGSTSLMDRLSELPAIGQYQRAISTSPLPGDRSLPSADSDTVNATDALKVRLLTQLTEELRTPLTSVMGMARILGQEVYGTLSPKQKE